MSETGKPHLTVAAVVEHDERFLLVEEQPDGAIVWNQPAGHVEPGESVIEAVVRETREETGRDFTPEALIGIYQWTSPRSGITFLRFAIAGTVAEADPSRKLDPEIIDTLWLSRFDIRGQQHKLRSPMVLRCIEDYLAGRRFPLDIVSHLT